MCEMWINWRVPAVDPGLAVDRGGRKALAHIS
jgi:hypothetical protein